MPNLLKIALNLWITGQLAAAAPTWQMELTSSKPGAFPQLIPTSLDLQISWKGLINSGNVHIEFAPPNAKKSGVYVIRSSAHSVGAAASLFPYQSHFWSELDPVTLRPRYFHSVESDKKETATTTVRHFPDRAVSQEISKLKQDATLWLSDDASRIPIELRAAVFIGDVRATLTDSKKL